MLLCSSSFVICDTCELVNKDAKEEEASQFSLDSLAFLCSALLFFQLKKVRSLLLAGAAEFDCFPQQLRLMEASFKLSAKDLRSQVVREACITLG